MSKEAMKLALEALKQIDEAMPFPVAKLAQSALREALASEAIEQPAPVAKPHEQEPVAWMWRCKPYCDWPEWSVSLKRPADSGRDGHKRTEGYEDVPLYTSPLAQRIWVGLTDEEVKHQWEVWRANVPRYTGFAKGIEAKLKEKNT